MPVGSMSPADIRRLCGVERIHAFTVLPTFDRCSVIDTKSWPYKGKFKTYPKFGHEARITSYAVVSEGMITLHHALRPTLVKLAPAGLIFAVDGNGLHLVRKSDGMDYHPSLLDWTAPDFARRVRKGLGDNRHRLLAMKKAQRLEAASKHRAARLARLMERDLPTTRVTLHDSRMAGNCIEGSLAFAERKLGLDRADILAASHLFTVSADRLLSVSNGDRPRVEAAVRLAWLRETTVAI